MSRNRRGLKEFGGPTFGDWALFGTSLATTGYFTSRLMRKTNEAKARRRSWEEEYDQNDVVYDYGSGYYLRDEND